MPHRPAARTTLAALTTSALVLTALGAGVLPAAVADEPADTYALVGSLQTELGCDADWAPDCAATELAPTATPGLYSAEFDLPAGSYDYKVAANDTWDAAWGLNGGADDVPLTEADGVRLATNAGVVLVGDVRPGA